MSTLKLNNFLKQQNIFSWTSNLKIRCFNNSAIQGYISNSFIHPQYISGLAQADSTFYVSLKKNPGLNKISTVLTFSITLDLDSIDTLYKIKNYFNCGKIYINKNKNAGEFVVSTIFEL